MNCGIFTVVPTWVLVHLRPKEEFLSPVRCQTLRILPQLPTACIKWGSENQRWPWVNRHAGPESCVWTAELAKTHPCKRAYFEVLFYPSPPNLELAYMKKRRRKKHNLVYIRVIHKVMPSWACVAPLV
jgi:hypothetical protein